MTGEAYNAKMGARLDGEGSHLWVDPPNDAWPNGPTTETMKVNWWM